MKVGTAPLTVAVMIAGARVLGLDGAADALGCLYLVMATVLMSRSEGLSAPMAAGLRG